ncbi:MAG TPA: hypothetical protein VFG65_02115 [Fimbriimonadales bacterium]|jgi:hypothetical protein|nr:hypothetical protein [Fimbriimonadales bacterium]
MSYSIGDYEFDGPYTQLYEIIDQRGIFAVLTSAGDEWRLLDVDAASSLRSGIANHPRAQKWKDACYYGDLAYAVYYTFSLSDAEMEDIVDELISAGHPKCRGT